MIGITIAYDLPFVAVTLTANNQQLTFDRVLLDTGSAATLFKTDDLGRLGIIPLPENNIRFMAGVGGTESVIEKQIDALQVDSLVVPVRSTWERSITRSRWMVFSGRFFAACWRTD